MGDGKGKTLVMLLLVGVLCLCVMIVAGTGGYLYLQSQDDNSSSSSKKNSEDNDDDDEEEADNDITPTPQDEDDDFDTTPSPTRRPTPTPDRNSSGGGSGGSSSSGATSYSTTAYEVEYNSDWYTEKQSSTDVVIYLENPTTTSLSVNENICIALNSPSPFTINSVNCSDFEEIINQQISQSTQYDVGTITDSGVTTLGSQSACYVEVFAIVNGVNLNQYVYAVSDNTEGSYIMVITVEEDSLNTSDFQDVAESFQFN